MNTDASKEAQTAWLEAKTDEEKTAVVKRYPEVSRVYAAALAIYHSLPDSEIKPE